MAKGNDRHYSFGFFKSKALKSALSRVPPMLWSATEEELAKMFTPTGIEVQIKCRFWNLVSLAPDSRSKFKLRRLYRGICSYSHMFNNILSRPEKVVWLLRPDPITSEAIRAAQAEALVKLNELVSAPVIRKSGQINSVAAKRVIEAVEILFAVEVRAKKG